MNRTESFELDAIDYLLKPFFAIAVLKACNKANEQMLLRNKTAPISNQLLFLLRRLRTDQIEPAHILYVESSGNYMQFVLDNRKIASLTMSEWKPYYLPILYGSPLLYCIKKHIQKMDKKYLDKTNRTSIRAYVLEIEKIIK